MGLVMRRNLMAAKSGYTAKDYVQDGLIAMWDGIENAGLGRHDTNATTWKDLIGGVGDMHFFVSGTKEPSLSPMVNVGDGYVSDGVNFCAADDVNEFLKNKDKSDNTIEFIMELSGGVGIPGKDVVTYIATEKIGMYSKNSFRYISFGHNLTTVGRDITSFPALICLSVCSTTDKGLFYHNSNVITEVEDSAYPYVYSSGGDIFGNGRMSLKIFANWIGTAINYSNPIKICALRIYDRVLSDYEIAANYAIDKARFNLPDVA